MCDSNEDEVNIDTPIQLSEPSLDSIPDYLLLPEEIKEEGRRAFIFKLLVMCGLFDLNKPEILELVDNFIEKGSLKNKPNLKVIKNEKHEQE
jgi:hypothetical protein